MPQTGLTWVRPPSELSKAVDQYGEKVWTAVTAVAQYMATQMQNDAKQTAQWADRTGNARSGLFGTAELELSKQMVTIYLSHGATVDYGVWLELAKSGRYAVIMRTIEANLPELKQMLDDLFR